MKTQYKIEMLDLIKKHEIIFDEIINRVWTVENINSDYVTVEECAALRKYFDEEYEIVKFVGLSGVREYVKEISPKMHMALKIGKSDFDAKEMLDLFAVENASQLAELYNGAW